MYRFIITGHKYVKLLASLQHIGKKSVRELSKEFDMNYPHLVNVMQQFQKEGIISRETDDKDTRAFLISLTVRGREIVIGFTGLRDTITTKHLSIEYYKRKIEFYSKQIERCNRKIERCNKKLAKPKISNGNGGEK